MAITSFALESDSGIFSYARAIYFSLHDLRKVVNAHRAINQGVRACRPVSIGFSGSDEAYEIMVGIGQRYLSGIGAGNVTRGKSQAC